MLQLLTRFIFWLFSSRDKNLESLFNTLEIEPVLSHLLNWCNDHIEAENVIWIKNDEYNLVLDQALGVKKKEPDQAMNRHIKFFPINEVKEDTFYSRIVHFHHDCSAPCTRQHGKNVDILYPFRDHNQNLLGYIFIVGVNKSSLRMALHHMNWLSQKASRHLGFAFEFFRVQGQALKDDLTGLYNQRFLSQVIEDEISRSKRFDRQFCVLFLDIDRFKLINDVNGHWVGSKLLIEVSHVLKSVLRKNDYAFRYGGDEFVVILPETDVEGALVAAERFRRVISSTDFIIDGVHLKLTVSVGLAGYPEHAKNYRDIIRMADEAMYCGKNKSRNIVFVANS